MSGPHTPTEQTSSEPPSSPPPNNSPSARFFNDPDDPSPTELVFFRREVEHARRTGRPIPTFVPARRVRSAMDLSTRSGAQDDSASEASTEGRQTTASSPGVSAASSPGVSAASSQGDTRMIDSEDDGQASDYSTSPGKENYSPHYPPYEYGNEEQPPQTAGPSETTYTRTIDPFNPFGINPFHTGAARPEANRQEPFRLSTDFRAPTTPRREPVRPTAFQAGAGSSSVTATTPSSSRAATNPADTAPSSAGPSSTSAGSGEVVDTSDLFRSLNTSMMASMTTPYRPKPNSKSEVKKSPSSHDLRR
ncbi:hypothetical protein CC80DRAFT_508851 [Byssothecium circinans]|uniref:Uncharacterized protein n=1 Tax=Byssothecium circinans TaxID=147558 RepID=A0A6A5TIF1_9PLEO|nr:hypothetical protein CC80DRAFT_508851 [Byssothecium circinans]